VVDETGDVKKGTATAGVQRQYTGTAGRVENAQVAVYLSYAGQGGHVLIDRELYLPQSWVADPARCAAAGIPKDTKFATKPELALAMIGRALDAGTPAGWVADDEVYGADPGLRAGIEKREVSYVLAVAKSHPVATTAGTVRADVLARKLPPRAWQRLSAGPGAKDHRWYGWAWVAIDPGLPGVRRGRPGPCRPGNPPQRSTAGAVAAVIGQLTGAPVAADQQVPVPLRPAIATRTARGTLGTVPTIS
jgi:SRSO17 transposase